VTSPTTIDYPPTEPLTQLTSPPPWKQTFASLSVRNFRIFALSNIIAMTAVWMQRIAQDWLVLELSGSVTAVGITVALQFAPLLVFGLIGGVIADRYPKRSLLMICQTVSVLTSATLAALVLTGTVEVWHIYASALLLGFVTVIDNPARQAFVGEMVGPYHLRNAISMNSSIFQLGALIGPAISGALLVAVGAGWSFGINALACAFVVTSLARLRSSELFRTRAMPRERGQLRAGIRYASSKPAILYTILIMGFLAVFGQNMPVILSAYAKDVFGVGAAGYGLFNTLVAVGALVGAVLSTRRRGFGLRGIVVAALCYSLVQTLSGLMPTEESFGVSLAAVGLTWLLFITAANSLVQLSSNTRVRGRVMALYALVLLGGQAIGGPAMGFIVEHLGAPTGMLISGGVPLVAVSVIAVVLARRGLLAKPGMTS
jgi:MFS family permease